MSHGFFGKEFLATNARINILEYIRSCILYNKERDSHGCTNGWSIEKSLIRAFVALLYKSVRLRTSGIRGFIVSKNHPAFRRTLEFVAWEKYVAPLNSSP